MSGFIFELPLISDFKDGLPHISSMYNAVKRSSDYYSNYIFACLVSIFIPERLSKLIVAQMTREVAMVFSNVPGPT